MSNSIRAIPILVAGSGAVVCKSIKMGDVFFYCLRNVAGSDNRRGRAHPILATWVLMEIGAIGRLQVPPLLEFAVKLSILAEQIGLIVGVFYGVIWLAG